MNYIFVAKAVVLLCMARKNRDADYVAVNFMWGDRTLSDDEYDEFVDYEQVLQLKERDRITIPEWVYDAHTKRGKKAGKNAIDFWKSEHECLEPRQLSLFDNGSWGGWYEHYDSEDGLSPRTRREYPEYAAGKETDPTHNGENMEMHEPNWGNQPRRK